jgi:hypothetical protein
VWRPLREPVTVMVLSCEGASAGKLTSVFGEASGVPGNGCTSRDAGAWDETRLAVCADTRTATSEPSARTSTREPAVRHAAPQTQVLTALARAFITKTSSPVRPRLAGM